MRVALRGSTWLSSMGPELSRCAEEWWNPTPPLDTRGSDTSGPRHNFPLSRVNLGCPWVFARGMPEYSRKQIIMKSVIKFVVFVGSLVFANLAQAGVAEYCRQSWTKAKVVTALVLQPGVSAWNTSVAVTDTGVTLSGVASSEAQAQLTEMVVQRYVSSVQSNIEAPSKGALIEMGSGIADTALQVKVYAALTKKTLINASIKVTCINGCVGLTGTAYSRAEKELAEELARGVRGVNRVVNNVQVVGE